MKKLVSFLGLMLILLHLTAQESIKLMHYNLMYYGKNTSFCNSSNNNQNNKNDQLKIIFDYVQPDIVCVNEMDASLADVNNLMDNTLNINGVNYWQHANVSGSYLINMLYYNSTKLNLTSQESIDGTPRQTDVYHMELLSDSEIKFTVFVTHLKAGNQASNEADRAYTTQKIMNYLSARNIDNYLITGDFNVYSSSEEAYQNLINPSNVSLAFNDPINRPGEWHNNYNFKDIHTQSTHTSGGCFAGGGMDDRFDFILISDAIQAGTHQVTYENTSYTTIGQDGNHYNQDVNSGTNSSVPSNVADALYEMSDHLPISLNLIVEGGGSVTPTTVIFNKDFEDLDLSSGGWSSFSVSGDAHTWSIPNSNYGHNNSHCAKITGWDSNSGTAIENEDWLISPPFNADNYNSTSLQFWTAGKYSGANLKLYYSGNYSGVGNPNNADWTELTGFNLSLGNNFVWESSGDIDLSNISGENVYIGFKYTSSPEGGSRMWELDDVKLVGTSNTGIVERLVNTFKIYPNPAKSHLTINVDETQNLDKYPFEIYNTMGIKLKSFYLTKNKEAISIESLKSGIYFIKNGTSVQKFTVEQ